MDEEEKKARREKLRKGVSTTRMARRWVMFGFDEIDDFNDFMKSAIKKEQALTSGRLDKGASGLEGEDLEQYWNFFAEDYQKIEDTFEMSMIAIMEPPFFAVMEPAERVEKGSSDPPFIQAISPPFEDCFSVL